jgi:hypothetical protein
MSAPALAILIIPHEILERPYHSHFLETVVCINMSHKLEGVLSLAKTYQLPLWTYSSHPQLNPYLLSSLGFRPVARGVLECHICLRRIILTE